MKIKRVVVLLRERPKGERAEKDLVFRLKQDYEVETEDEWWEFSDSVPGYLDSQTQAELTRERAGLGEEACIMTVWMRLV